MRQGCCTFVITATGEICGLSFNHLRTSIIIPFEARADPALQGTYKEKKERKKERQYGEQLVIWDEHDMLFVYERNGERKEGQVKERVKTDSHLISISLHSLCTHFHEFKTESA
jgi:hypothetical protein